jgi:Na+/H+ antiporter NhaC
MTATSPFDLIRPFFWIAAVAFVIGFVAFALLGAGSIARTAKTPDPTQASAPVEPQAGVTLSV